MSGKQFIVGWAVPTEWSEDLIEGLGFKWQIAMKTRSYGILIESVQNSRINTRKSGNRFSGFK